jgi:hypothetical protein
MSIERKFLKYKIATACVYKHGDTFKGSDDLCYVYNEDEENWYGCWVEGFGFFDVAFPKATTRNLTQEELDHYKGVKVRLSDHPAQPAIPLDYVQEEG